MNKKAIICCIGALAGCVNGLFGAGGGIVLVLALRKWAGLDEKTALATSVAVILPLSIVSFGVYWFSKGINFAEALPYAVGGMGGGLLASKVFRKMPLIWLKRLFGILLLLGGIKGVLLK